MDVSRRWFGLFSRWRWIKEKMKTKQEYKRWYMEIETGQGSSQYKHPEN
jgi:hypothetical protein